MATKPIKTKLLASWGSTPLGREQRRSLTARINAVTGRRYSAPRPVDPAHIATMRKQLARYDRRVQSQRNATVTAINRMARAAEEKVLFAASPEAALKAVISLEQLAVAKGWVVES